MFKNIRVSILIYILIIVAAYTYISIIRTTDWDETLHIVVYPINADGSKSTERYINSVSETTFQSVAKFFKKEAAAFSLAADEPIEIILGKELTKAPPARPEASFGLSAIVWSLKLRYYAWAYASEPADIQLFIMYYNPETHPKLMHSTGLQKGLVGVVNVFASREYAASNNVIIAHEFLHTVGASDKYDLSTGLPIETDGFAAPDQVPLYPQKKAEIMGGRIPISPTRADIPRSLRQVMVGEKTAQEINWS